MEVKARCVLNLDVAKALVHLGYSKKSNPRKMLYFSVGLCLAVLALGVAELLFFEFNDITIALLFSDLLFLAFSVFYYFYLPKIQYKSMSKFKDIENEYTFFDNEMKIRSVSKEYNGEETISYSLLVKAYETSRYIFLYQTQRMVLVVDKATVTGGRAEDIRNKLRDVLQKKYIFCKY